MPNAKYVFKDLSCYIPIIDKSTTLPLTTNHINIVKSEDKVWFIQYTPIATMKSILYLV